MNNKNGLLVSTLLGAGLLMGQAAQAQTWPQPENAYMSSTQSPQWVENNNTAPAQQANQQIPQNYSQPGAYQNQQMNNYPTARYPNQNGYGQQQPWNGMPYQPQNQGWGNWPNMGNNSMPNMGNMSNNSMPSMPNMGNWNAPNMNMGNWNMPSMPDMNNMPGMPNMNNMSMPNMDMPSPSMTFPNMNMPFFN